MPEHKMTYQERVEKMARLLNAAGTGYAPYKQIHDQLHLGLCAKEAVYRQAVAIRTFYASLGELPYWDEKYLLEHGYIEPKHDFHCNNKGRHFSDPGYKPVCDKQCESCKEYIEPKTEDDGK